MGGFYCREHQSGYDAATCAKIQVLRLADALPVDHGALRNLVVLMTLAKAEPLF